MIQRARANRRGAGGALGSAEELRYESARHDRQRGKRHQHLAACELRHEAHNLKVQRFKGSIAVFSSV